MNPTKLLLERFYFQISTYTASSVYLCPRLVYHTSSNRTSLIAFTRASCEHLYHIHCSQLGCCTDGQKWMGVRLQEDNPVCTSAGWLPTQLSTSCVNRVIQKLTLKLMSMQFMESNLKPTDYTLPLLACTI